MAEQPHDVLVVGGGVCGACIARDAAMRGLRVALVERTDFAHATSAASSKLIHGGLRYLKNFELSLVRESLRERRAWEIIAPHLVYPLPFVVPAYRRPRSSKRWMLRVGLTLYELLAFDRNRLDDEDRKLPGHTMLSADEALARVPVLEPEDLEGAVEYWDCQMYSPERLALSCVLDAVAHGAQVANRAAVRSIIVRDGRAVGAVVHDGLHDGPHAQEVTIEARMVVNATGPWADHLQIGSSHTPAHPLTRSKGIHVITRALTGDVALAVESRRGHVFVLPWRGHSLIGTTDVVYDGHPDDFAVTETDIADFLEAINAALPSAALTRGDVLHFYGGLRPLVESAGKGSYDASRRAEVVDHEDEGGPTGLISALGGKWTTARALAEQVVDRVARRLGAELPACQTAVRPLPGGAIGTWAEFVSTQTRRHERVPAPVVEHLARNYGTQMDAVLALADEEPELLEAIGAGRVERRAEVVYAVRHEMATALDDVLFRRTGLGTLGDPGPAVIDAVVDLMARELHWTDDERARQRAALQRTMVPAT